MMRPKPLNDLMRKLVVGDAAPGVQIAQVPVPAVRVAPPVRNKARTKLWDLEEKHLCPVVGTCVPLEELERFAKRYRFDADLRDAFAMHVEAVCYAKTRNAISEAMQRHLDHKYERVVAQFNHLKTDAEVFAAWKACLAQGEVAGPLWAAYTHKATSALTRHRIYEDIHMLSHQIGAGQAADARRLAHLERENAELKATLEAERAQAQRSSTRLQECTDELARTKAEQSASAAETEALRARLAQHESGALLGELREQVERLQQANRQMAAAMQRVWDLDRALREAREQAESAARERDLASQEREALERMLLAASQAAPDSAPDCDTCVAANSARCVLCVGGRTSLVTQYRELAERLGIRLLHHDGGQEESLSRLPELIHGADAVVCPTDCVSHSAYYHLKNQCKRIGKPCLFFKGASVSSFALAMTRVSSGEYSLAGQADT